MSAPVNLATLVVLGHITAKEAERIENDVIYRTGLAYAPMDRHIGDFEAALARVRAEAVDDTRTGGIVPE